MLLSSSFFLYRVKAVFYDLRKTFKLFLRLKEEEFLVEVFTHTDDFLSFFCHNNYIKL